MHVDPSGNLTERADIVPSHPAPEFTDVSVELLNVRPSPDYTRLLGDVRISATIDSRLADIIAGTQGTIDAAQLYVNGREEPYALSVASQKASQPLSLVRPFDFTGTIQQTISAVELAPGYNTFRLSARDKISRLSGFAEHINEVKLTPPSPNYEFQFEFSQDPYADATTNVTVSVQVSQNGSALGAATLSRAALGSREFRGNLLGTPFALALDQLEAFDSSQPDQRSVSVSWAERGLTLGAMIVGESGPNTRIFEGGAWVEEHQRETYRDYGLSAEPGWLAASSLSPSIICLRQTTLD
jgi:hypothetical protein